MPRSEISRPRPSLRARGTRTRARRFLASIRRASALSPRVRGGRRRPRSHRRRAGPAPEADQTQPGRPRGRPARCSRPSTVRASRRGPSWRAGWRAEPRRIARAGLLIGEINADYLWATFDQSLIASGTILDGEGRQRPRAGQLGGRGATPRSRPWGSMPSPMPIRSPASTASPTSRPPGRSCSTRCSPRPPGASCWATPGRGHGTGGGVHRHAAPHRVLRLAALVLVLSVDRIRRSLLPLRELQQGTRRIAERDFASRVSIRSRDEFEELGASFNAMATQLDRQFQALATAAEIDRAVLSATSASEIVATLLARLRDVYPCGVVSVTLMAPDGAKSLPSLVHDYTEPAGRTSGWISAPTTCRSCSKAPTRSCSSTVDEAGLPPYVAPLVELGYRPVLRPAAPVPEPAGRRHRAGGRVDGAGRCRRADAGPATGRPGRGGAGERADAGAGAHPGLLRQPDRSAQPAVLQGAPGERAGGGQPATEAGGGVLHRPRPLQPDQRHAGPRGRRPAAAAGGRPAPVLLPRAGGRGRPRERGAGSRGGAAGRRRVHRDHAGPRPTRRTPASSPAGFSPAWRIRSGSAATRSS